MGPEPSGLLNLEHRGVERDLLPFCTARGMPVMAYSPLGQGGGLLRQAALGEVAARHGVWPAAAALAWVLAKPDVIAIPEAASSARLRRNLPHPGRGAGCGRQRGLRAAALQGWR